MTIRLEAGSNKKLMEMRIMSYMNFTKANCRNCYKCLRACPVKAIKFKNEQAEISEDRCIYCGHCLAICPQNARNIKSDLIRVKAAIASGRKVIASLAPSFAGSLYPLEGGQLIVALRGLGFSAVEEAAEGAEVVSGLYRSYAKEKSLDYLLTTCCPSVNLLIEKYYPELIKYLMPFISPMVAHGKLLKSYYGEESFVVFIGPCAAKKLEAEEAESGGAVDAVLTFEEVRLWLEDEGIKPQSIKEEAAEGISLGRFFPLSGGILKGFKEEGIEGYELLSVSGTDECMELLGSIKRGELDRIIVELSACKGSCIGGPSRVRGESGFYKRRKRVIEYIKSRESMAFSVGKGLAHNILGLGFNDGIDKESFSRSFTDKSAARVQEDEEALRTVLHSMGKLESKDELNCGVCGYNTCREKAQAVLEGMAETNMCLHYMRTKAESITNIIFESTPNCVVLLDEGLRVLEFNPAAEETFLIKAEEIKGKPISMLIEDEDFIKVRDSKIDIRGRKVAYPQYNVAFIENIIYLESQGIILITMDNIMAEERNRVELLKIKENTLEAAQKVIEKQMRVAQEIASLLGETTAETKMTLVNLKKLLIGEEGGGR